MAHTHDVYDMENHFEINGSSRFIKETSETKLVVVQGDHKSEVLTFKMPRYIDGHDMTLCNKIRIHYINLDTKTNNKSADVYEVTDLTLCEECEDVLTFTWTIEAPATKYSGTLSFLVKFECTEGENVLYQWNTAKYVSVNVLAGIDNSEEFVEKYSNVLEEWYNELTKGADSIEELNQQALAEIELAKEDAKEDIQGKADATMAEMNQFSSNAYNSFKNDVDEKAAKTLESIPEEYQTLAKDVVEFENKAKNKDLYLFPLKNIESGNVNGINIVNNGNGTYMLNGTSTDYVLLDLYTEKINGNNFFLCGCPYGGSEETYSIQYSNFSTKAYTDIGNGIAIPNSLEGDETRVIIRITPNTTLNNLLFSPKLIKVNDKEPIQGDPYSALTCCSFNLKAIKTESNMILKDFEEHFIDNYGISEIITEHRSECNTDVVKVEYNNGVTIKSVLQAPASAFCVLSCLDKVKAPTKEFTVSIESCNCRPLIGFMSASDNYILLKIEPSYSGGGFSIYTNYKSETNSYHFYGDIISQEFKDVINSGKPYKVTIAIGTQRDNLIGLKNIECDGKIIIPVTIADYEFPSISGWANSSNTGNTSQYMDWQFCFGMRIEGHESEGAELKVSEVYSGFSSGFSIGADFKPIRYSSGEPIVDGNCIYITSTCHNYSSVDVAGNNIYKLNLSNYKLEFVGKIFGVYEKEIWDGSSPTVIYDKESKTFICGFSEFAVSGYKPYGTKGNWLLSIGKTKENLLDGIHFVNTQAINADFNNEHVWDLDFIIRNGHYVGTLKGGRIVESESLDMNSRWTVTKQLSDGFEGNTITRLGATDIMIQTDGSKLSAYFLNNGSKITDITFDKFPKTNAFQYEHVTPVWGSIIPICQNNTTKYYAILFSMRSVYGRKYSYGDMWIYEGIDTLDGHEYYGF